MGDIRAASYGFTLGGAVGLSMIEADEPIDEVYLEAGTWEVNIAGKLYLAEVPFEAHVRPGHEAGEGLRFLSAALVEATRQCRSERRSGM